MIKFKLFIVFAFIILSSTNLLALTLNKMQVSSKQNEPLNAVIDVIFSKGDKASNLKPAIASRENYEANGLSRLPIHSDIQIRIEADNNGAKLYLTSNEIVEDPFLDLLIQIDSEKGRVYKEYTVLLEPPAPKIAAKEVKEIKEVKEAKKVKEVKEAKTKIVKSSNRKTLYQIARENKPSGVTTEQMVLAIYDTNPKAFAEDNVNTLIKNKNLKIPSIRYFENHTHLEARKILRDHNNEWKNVLKKIKKDAKPKKIKKLKVIDNKDSDKKIKQLEKELVEAKLKLDEILKSNIESKNNLNALEDKTKNDIEKASKENEILNKDASQSKEEVTNKKFTKNEIEEKDGDVFVSSISDIEEAKIEEIKIEGKNKNGLETVHYLLLVLFFTLLFGLFVIISRRKANERNQQLRSFADEVGSEKENQPADNNNGPLSARFQASELNQEFSEETISQEQSNPTGKKNYLPIADDEDEKKL